MARKGLAKEVFIQRALDIFMENGLRTTMDEISHQIRVSKHTIYEQFEDKTDLVRACLACLLRNRPDLVVPKKERLMECMYNSLYANMMAFFGKPSRFLIQVQRHYPDLYSEQVNPVIARVKEYLLALIRESMDNGYMRTDIQTDVMLSYMLKYVFLVASDSETMFFKYPPAEIFHNTIYPAMRGMLTNEGVRRMDKAIKEASKK